MSHNPQQQVDANFLKARFRQTLANDGTPLPPVQRKTREQIRAELKTTMKSKGIPCVSEDPDMDDTIMERVNAPSRPAKVRERQKPLNWKRVTSSASVTSDASSTAIKMPAAKATRAESKPKTNAGSPNRSAKDSNKTDESVLRIRKKKKHGTGDSGKSGKSGKAPKSEDHSSSFGTRRRSRPKKPQSEVSGKSQKTEDGRTTEKTSPEKTDESSLDSSLASESDVDPLKKTVPPPVRREETKVAAATSSAGDITKSPPKEEVAKKPEDTATASEKKEPVKLSKESISKEHDRSPNRSSNLKKIIAQVTIDAEEVEAKKATMESVDEMDLLAQKQAEEQQIAAQINDVDPIWIPCAVQILRFIHKEKALEGAMTKKENEMLAKFFAGMLAYNDTIMTIINNAMEKIFEYAKAKNVKVPNKKFYDNKILAKKAIFDALITNPQYLPSSWKTKFMKWREEADRERYGINLIKILTTYPKQRSFDDSEVKNDGTFTPKARNLFWGVIIGPSDQKSFEDIAMEEAAKGIYFDPTLANKAIATKSAIRTSSEITCDGSSLMGSIPETKEAAPETKK